MAQQERISLNNTELERILGGGLVPGSVVLLGGEPGIGKSTLSLQIPLQAPDLRTLYVSGEESARQIRMRARTYISFDGDMEVCLPVREDGSVDRELWQIHSDTVKQAQINRTEFLKTVADLTARLVGK